MPQIISGMEAVIGGLRKRAADDTRKTNEILVEAAFIGLRHIRPFVPVDKGDLVATGRVETYAAGFQSHADIVFGGVSPGGRLVDYAVYVHEDLEKGHTPPTCAKFMTVGLRKAMPFITRWIGAAFQSSGPVVVQREVEV